MAASTHRAHEHEPPAEWFERWWPPLEFLTVVHQHNRDVPSEAFFARADLQPLREAYAAGLFATILSGTQAVALRLRRDRFPDFDLRTGERIQAFELVEADRPGRKRGDEYKEAARREAKGLPSSVEHFDPDAEEQAAPEAIRLAIARKARKHYAPAPPLLVYVNFWLFHAPSLTQEQFAELVAPWRGQFPEIWLLWGANAIRCWPNPTRLVAQSLPDELVP